MKKAMKWTMSGLLAAGAAVLIPVQAFAAGETMGEKLKFAAQNTVINIIVVFCMLVLIALVIYCFRFLPKLTNLFKKKEKTESQPEPEKVKAESQTPPPPRREEKEDKREKAEVPVSTEADYTELIAVIAAAIAADEQVPVGSFVVRTVKKRV